jgi:hypothetical protein
MSGLHVVRRAGIAIGLVAAISAAPTAMAAGNGAFTDTQTIHDMTQSFPTDSMCGSPAGTLTATVSGVLHVTVKGTDVRLAATLQGEFTLLPDDVTLPTFAGHFVTVFGRSDGDGSTVQHEAFNAHGVATDGSGATIDIHGIDHLTVSPSDEVTFFVTCH